LLNTKLNESFAKIKELEMKNKAPPFKVSVMDQEDERVGLDGYQRGAVVDDI